MSNLAIIDLKTATSESKLWRVQTAGYAQLYMNQTNANIEFDEASHLYKVNGLLVPSVSQVISDNFYSNFDNVNKTVMDRACSFGKAFHSATQYLDEERLDLNSIDKGLAPYLVNYEKFKKEYIKEYVVIEKMFYSKKLNVCGRIDRVAVMKEESKSIRRIVVIIRENDYQVIEHKDRSDTNAFISACSLTNWRLVNKIKGANHE